MAHVRFGVLGGLEVKADAGPVAIAGPRRRALLALLVVHANRVVSTGRVIDSLWGADEPASARAQVHSLISALRQELPDSAEGGPAIETRPGLHAHGRSGNVDLFVFERRVAVAGRRRASAAWSRRSHRSGRRWSCGAGRRWTASTPRSPTRRRPGWRSSAWW
jgi:DNA-binding SARP family transcriptional activator